MTEWYGVRDTEAVKRIQKILKRLTYKPNWSLSFLADTCTVYIEARVPDVTRKDDALVPLVRAVRFSPEYAAEDDIILARLKHAIREMEHHETEEWLRLDGVPLDDPHPEISKRPDRCTCEPPWSAQPSYCGMHGNVSIYAKPKP